MSSYRTGQDETIVDPEDAATEGEGHSRCGHGNAVRHPQDGDVKQSRKMKPGEHAEY